MDASASIVLIDYSEHGLHRLHGMLSVESGQSVVLLRGRYAQNFKKIIFKIIQISYDEGKALQKCRFCTVSTSVVVRLLSARCPVVVQSLTGQQLDNNWTTNGQRAKLVWLSCLENTGLVRCRIGAFIRRWLRCRLKMIKAAGGRPYLQTTLSALSVL